MGESSTDRGKTITLAATVKNIATVTAFLEQELEALDCPVKAAMQISVAADEIVTNIAMYAYTPGSGDVTVQFAFDAATRTAEIAFTDSGTPFDPLKKADPDVTLSAEEREIGGLGIFLVKKTMDEVLYRRENGRNILTIRKKI